MKINVDEKAANWFKQEMELSEGKAIRFYVRYGGDFQLKQGFSPAFTVETIDEKGYVDETDGIAYFVDEKDMWYYEDDVINVTFEDDEITYEKSESA